MASTSWKAYLPMTQGGNQYLSQVAFFIYRDFSGNAQPVPRHWNIRGLRKILGLLTPPCSPHGLPSLSRLADKKWLYQWSLVNSIQIIWWKCNSRCLQDPGAKNAASPKPPSGGGAFKNIDDDEVQYWIILELRVSWMLSKLALNQLSQSLEVLVNGESLHHVHDWHL